MCSGQTPQLPEDKKDGIDQMRGAQRVCCNSREAQEHERICSKRTNRVAELARLYDDKCVQLNRAKVQRQFMERDLETARADELACRNECDKIGHQLAELLGLPLK